MPKLIVLIVGLIGAGLGHLSQLPMGVLLGSFLSVALLQVYNFNADQFSKRTKQAVQMLIGGFIGLSIKPEMLQFIPSLIIPSLIAVLVHLLFALLLSIIYSKIFNISRFSAFVGVIPAGMSEVVLVLDDLKVDSQVIVFMHLFRISMLVTLLPVLIKYFF